MINGKRQVTKVRDGPLLLVLGMHRSGTSAVARVCDLLGVDLGGEVLAPQAGVNEAGFWEHEGVVALNESVLEALDRRWFDIGPIEWDALDSQRRQSLQARAATLLRSDFLGKGAVLIKDPRMCRLMPLWLPAAASVGLECRVVLVLRHPQAVARSLARRDGFDLDTAYWLWLRHLLEAELGTRGLPRVLMDYDELLSDPSACARRLIEQLDLVAIASELSRVDLGGAVPVTLRHHVPPEGPDAGSMAELAAFVYESIRENELASDALPSCLQQAADRLETTTRQCGDCLGTLERTNRLLVAARVRLSEIGELHSVALATLSERDSQLDELRTERGSLGKELGHAMVVVSQRDSQLQSANAERERLGQELGRAIQVVQERDAQLAAANTERERLRRELGPAIVVVQDRDAQLATANAERESLGAQLGHAIAVVQERDAQLVEAAADRARLEGRLSRLMAEIAHHSAQLDRLQQSWLGPLVRRLIRERG